MASSTRNTWTRVYARARARAATWLLASVAGCPAPGQGTTGSTDGAPDTTGTGTSTGGSVTVTSGSSSTTTDGTTAPTSGPVVSSTSSSSTSSTSLTGEPTGSSTTSASTTGTSTDSTTTDPSSTTQAEVCPGGSVHEGDLVITDDTDLTALTCIVEVTGDLKIVGTNLTSFLELGNLEYVHGDVNIGENPALVDLDGLSSLAVVGDGGLFTGHIVIYYNPALVDITGLHSIVKVRSVELHGCDALTDLSGLQGNIDSFDDDGWGLGITENASLENLDGLSAIEKRRGIGLGENPILSDISTLELILDPDAEHTITIRGNPALTDLVGLEVVKQAFVVQIVDNDGLTDLHGLDNLQTASDGIQIADNDGLTSLAGLGQLTSVKKFYIENNPVLASLSGLDNLTDVLALRVGDCTSDGNASLVDLHGLEHVATIVALEVRKNAGLVALDGLDGLQSLAQLVAEFNPMLPPAEATDLAAQFGATTVLCNNLGPPEDCECSIIMP